MSNWKSKRKFTTRLTRTMLTRRSDAPRGSVVTLLCVPLCLLMFASLPAWAEPANVALSSLLETGFSGLYNLDFAGAQKDFSNWEAQHPDDPVGPVSEAAGYLFSEFNRLGVLEAQFY